MMVICTLAEAYLWVVEIHVKNFYGVLTKSMKNTLNRVKSLDSKKVKTLDFLVSACSSNFCTFFLYIKGLVHYPPLTLIN